MTPAWTDADWTAFRGEVEARWYKGEVRTPEQWDALRDAVTTRDPDWIAQALDHLHLRIDAVPSAARILQTADELRDRATTEQRRHEEDERARAEHAAKPHPRRVAYATLRAWREAGCPGLDEFVHTALNPPPPHLTNPLDLAAWPNCLVAPPDWPVGTHCPPDKRVPLNPDSIRNIELMLITGQTRTTLPPTPTSHDTPPRTPPRIPPPTQRAPWQT